MEKREICVRNHAGIHCRPASVILNAVNQDFPETRICLISEGEEVELKSILSLISLGLCCGAKAELLTEGKDEEKAIKVIGDLFEKEFDFPPR